MPITSIISQPATNALRAAYRPIVLIVADSGNPPVVYCDIYINNVFYKTQSKTQFIEPGQFLFDIQDACQEVLKKQIGENGGTDMIPVTGILASVYCKFRSSSYDSDGFVTPQATVPKQATGSNPAVAGSGTQSNTFYVINSVLQHLNNQDLTAHLNAYKNGTWNQSYPLTHRPNGYALSQHDSDYFPILTEKTLKCIKINYRMKGETSFQSVNTCGSTPCTGISIGSFSFADAITGSPYNKVVALSGTAPFSLDSFSGPTWMNADISGSTIVFSGTPSGADIGTDSISFTVSNGCGSVTINKTIEVQEPTCIAAGGTLSMPDGIVGTAYSYSFSLLGTAPFSLSSIVKPAWMTINLSGSTINFSGTPDTEGSITVSFNVNNCVDNSAPFSDTIEIIQEGDTYAGFSNRVIVFQDESQLSLATDFMSSPGDVLVFKIISIIKPSTGWGVMFDSTPCDLDDEFTLTADSTGKVFIRIDLNSGSTTGDRASVNVAIISSADGNLFTDSTFYAIKIHD